jgi:hypothetical protein
MPGRQFLEMRNNHMTCISSQCNCICNNKLNGSPKVIQDSGNVPYARHKVLFPIYHQILTVDTKKCEHFLPK